MRTLFTKALRILGGYDGVLVAEKIPEQLKPSLMQSIGQVFNLAEQEFMTASNDGASSSLYNIFSSDINKDELSLRDGIKARLIEVYLTELKYHFFVEELSVSLQELRDTVNSYLKRSPTKNRFS